MKQPARGMIAVLGLLVLSLTPLPALADPIEQRVEEHRNDVGEIDKRGVDFVHRASGYVYPGKLGEMPARKTITFGTADAEVYYTLYGGKSGDAWVSLYVYPAALSQADEQRGIEEVIVGNYSATPIARPSVVVPPAEGVTEGWYKATIEGDPIVTGARVIQINGWNIKVRVSVPVSGGKAALDRAAGALRAIPMTGMVLRPPARATSTESARAISVG